MRVNFNARLPSLFCKQFFITHFFFQEIYITLWNGVQVAPIYKYAPEKYTLHICAYRVKRYSVVVHMKINAVQRTWWSWKEKKNILYVRACACVCIGFISYCPCRADIVINWQKKFQSVKLCLGNIHVKNLTRAKTRGHGSNNKITVIGSKTYNVPEGPSDTLEKG